MALSMLPSSAPESLSISEPLELNDRITDITTYVPKQHRTIPAQNDTTKNTLLETENHNLQKDSISEPISQSSITQLTPVSDFTTKSVPNWHSVRASDLLATAALDKTDTDTELSSRSPPSNKSLANDSDSSVGSSHPPSNNYPQLPKNKSDQHQDDLHQKDDNGDSNKSNKIHPSMSRLKNNGDQNGSVMPSASPSGKGGKGKGGSSASNSASSATTTIATISTSTLNGNDSVTGGNLGVSEIKLKRFLEHNQRLKEQLEMQRISGSEASESLIKFVTSTKDSLLPTLWGNAPTDPFSKQSTGCCTIS